jgi:hypothetical protein
LCEAQVGLDERQQPHGGRRRTKAVEGAAQQAQIHRADHLRVRAGGGAERAGTQSDLAGLPVASQLGVEPEVGEEVESLEASMADLAAAGLDVEAPESPDGTDEFLTTWITDPDGNRIELVQRPAGHADGITAADWPD